MPAEGDLPPGRGERWSLAPHVAALAVVMLVLLPVVGWHGVFSSDEGAGVAQARALSDHGSFTLAHPFPRADPTGAAFPLEMAGVSDEGYSPLPKKPAYVVLLAGADRVAGLPGMIALSIAGTVVAALMAARVARRTAPSLTILTFWVAGMASPLFTDGYLIIAHSLGAAVCGAALLTGLRLRERLAPLDVLALVSLLVAAAFLRAEAVLFGVALSAGLAVVGWRRTERRAQIVAAVGLVAVIGGWLLDRSLAVAAFGRSVGLPPVGGGDGDGLLVARLRGLLTTWFRPGYGDPRPASLLIIAVAVVGLLLAAACRPARPDGRLVRTAAALLLALAMAIGVTFSVADPQIVPGLVLAFPALVWGLVSLDRSTLRNPVTQILVVTGSLFALAVLATQYAIGGAWEWGGRYFAVGLPCVAPLVAAGLRDAARRLPAGTRTLGIASVATASLAMTVMGVASVRSLHDGWSEFVGAVVATSRSTEAGDGGSPVIVSTERELPRAAWADMDRSRWLLVPDARLPAMLERLEGLGVDELTLVTKGSELTGALAASPYAVVGGTSAPPDPDDWWITTLRQRG